MPNFTEELAGLKKEQEAKYFANKQTEVQRVLDKIRDAKGKLSELQALIPVKLDPDSFIDLRVRNIERLLQWESRVESILNDLKNTKLNDNKLLLAQYQAISTVLQNFCVINSDRLSEDHKANYEAYKKLPALFTQAYSTLDNIEQAQNEILKEYQEELGLDQPSAIPDGKLEVEDEVQVEVQDTGRQPSATQGESSTSSYDDISKKLSSSNAEDYISNILTNDIAQLIGSGFLEPRDMYNVAQSCPGVKTSYYHKLFDEMLDRLNSSSLSMDLGGTTYAHNFVIQDKAENKYREFHYLFFTRMFEFIQKIKKDTEDDAKRNAEESKINFKLDLLLDLFCDVEFTSILQEEMLKLYQAVKNIYDAKHIHRPTSCDAKAPEYLLEEFYLKLLTLEQGTFSLARKKLILQNPILKEVLTRPQILEQICSKAPELIISIVTDPSLKQNLDASALIKMAEMNPEAAYIIMHDESLASKLPLAEKIPLNIFNRLSGALLGMILSIVAVPFLFAIASVQKKEGNRSPHWYKHITKSDLKSLAGPLILGLFMTPFILPFAPFIGFRSGLRRGIFGVFDWLMMDSFCKYHGHNTYNFARDYEQNNILPNANADLESGLFNANLISSETHIKPPNHLMQGQHVAEESPPSVTVEGRKTNERTPLLRQ